jgi:hypothetical protein
MRRPVCPPHIVVANESIGCRFPKARAGFFPDFSELNIMGWYRSKVLARYISVEKDTVSLYGGVIAKPSRAKGERPWWNRKYISYFAFVLQLER